MVTLVMSRRSAHGPCSSHRSDQPDELVYTMVKAVFDNFAVFRQLHPALSSLEIREMVPSGLAIPIHPGALNYYRDVGLIH